MCRIIVSPAPGFGGFRSKGGRFRQSKCQGARRWVFGKFFLNIPFFPRGKYLNLNIPKSYILYSKHRLLMDNWNS